MPWLVLQHERRLWRYRSPIVRPSSRRLIGFGPTERRSAEGFRLSFRVTQIFARRVVFARCCSQYQQLSQLLWLYCSTTTLKHVVAVSRPAYFDDHGQINLCLDIVVEDRLPMADLHSPRVVVQLCVGVGREALPRERYITNLR